MKGFEGLFSLLKNMNSKFISPSEIESGKFIIVFKNTSGY